MKRPRIVPPSGVEIFQVRTAYWYNEEGKPMVSVHVDETSGHEPSLVELLGILRRAETIVSEMYDEGS